jgi:hypothetical protein
MNGNTLFTKNKMLVYQISEEIEDASFFITLSLKACFSGQRMA